MSSQPASQGTQPVKPPDPKPKKQRSMSQEKFMIFLCLIFFGGVALLTIFSIETPVGGVMMGLYMILVTWFIYRWGVGA